MSSINIPEEDIEALFSFSQLSEDIKNGVFETLGLIKLGDHPKNLSKKFSEQYNIDYDDIFAVLNFYFALLKTIYQTKLDDEEVISELIDSIAENDFEFDVEDLNRIENTIKSFISIKNEIPLITSLAFDVALSTNNLLLRSFIYEDLRPVFLDEKISGLALYHTCRLHFRKEDRSHSDLYFTIDNEDIDNLISQLTLAKARIAIIKAQYGEIIVEI